MYFNFQHPYRWHPWSGGCTPVSPGCKHCFVIKHPLWFNGWEGLEQLDENSFVMVTLNSDFFLPAADEYRKKAWEIMYENNHLVFLIITKRVERIKECLPNNWGEGYENVILAVTVEDQDMADYRLPIFQTIPAKHKWLSLAPLLEDIELSNYLQDDNIELIETTGEKAMGAAFLDDVRPCEYEWLKRLSKQCKEANVRFYIMSCGGEFVYNDELIIDNHACYRSPVAQGLGLDITSPAIIFNLKSGKHQI